MILPPRILSADDRPFHCGLVNAVWGRLIEDHQATSYVPKGVPKKCLTELAKDKKTIEKMKEEFFLDNLSVDGEKITFKRNKVWQTSPALKKKIAA